MDPTSIVLATEAAKEAAKLVPEAYRDGFKPAVIVGGKALEAVANLGLEIVKLFADGGIAAIQKLRAVLTERAATIPPERQIAPPAVISGPATLQYIMLGDHPDTEGLREMFVKLLMAAMDSATVENAHPAFVSMISQLTPGEGWLLQSINKADYAAVERVRYTEHGKIPLGFVTTLGKDLGIPSRTLQQYVSNLDRLGILRIDFGDTASDNREQDEVEKLGNGDDETFGHAGAIKVTPFGEQFLNTCVRIPSAQ